MSFDLIKLDQAKQLLAECESVTDAKEFIDTAEAARHYAQVKGLGTDAGNYATEIKLRAIRRLGELLEETPRSNGGRPSSLKTCNRGGTGLDIPTLPELGISRKQSSQAQSIAHLPEQTFEQHIAKTKAKGELTTAGVLKLAKNLKKKTEREQQIETIKSYEPPTGKHHVIVVDPPWQYDNRANDTTHRAANPYPSMTLQEIAALSIPDLALDDCVLWLWTTNAFMEEAHHIVKVWGFEKKTILTWVKDKIGLGDWLRGQTEHCLMCIKGKPIIDLTNQSTVIYGPMREHSRKPDEFYCLIEELCPGSKAELFAREEREGWNGYGSELQRFNGSL